MYQEYNLFYADWRTKQGKRKRKSFSTAEAASAFEAVQKEAAHPKRRGVAGRLLKLSTPSSRNGKQPTGKPATTSTSSRKRSSRSQETPTFVRSPKRTS